MVEQNRAKELPPHERMASEIFQAAGALGMEVSLEQSGQWAREVMDALDKLKKAVRVDTVYKRPKDGGPIYELNRGSVEKNMASVHALGGVEKVVGGIAIWGMGSSSGYAPIPNDVVLARIISNQDGADPNSYVLMDQYPLATFNPVTDKIDFDNSKQIKTRSAHSRGRIFLRTAVSLKLRA